MTSSTANIVPPWNPPAPTTHDLDWAEILTVDLEKDTTDRDELVAIVSKAVERDGFLYVVGHGIPDAVLERQFDLGQLCFDGVDRAEKEAHQAKIKETGSWMGYKLQKYWQIKDGVRDRIEHYNFYQNHIEPAKKHPRAIQPHVAEIQAFILQSRTVLWRILSLIDSVLGLEEGYLWSLHQTPEGTTSDDVFRYMMYEPLTAAESATTKGVMLNGHTDFNSISILISQPIAALQVLMPDNVWRFVKHRDGALVINLGDQLSFMSGGIVKATMHRVVSPPPDQVHLRRLGVFHFAHFLPGVPLDLLPSDRVRKDGRQIFDGAIPTTDEWERKRVKSYGTEEFIKGEEYDIEMLAGLQIRHYH
ncbi:unnamed protein product [Mycena citricolor]|uniref:Clavaminate synthase-like protein n=1 Tax=Mycena citricolor TaxID=2018698 RepID=A0AAD2JVD0_9AGAR|nr:unnamed protein product [Mycena citricolor]